tara:strand:- start:122 stop:1078 length:957 start_codon:yes stop_codon:yes gene_type:complete
MIKEFAVDLDVLSDYDFLKNHFNDFGVPNGRLIYQIPGKKDFKSALWKCVKAKYEHDPQKLKDFELRICGQKVKPKHLCKMVPASASFSKKWDTVSNWLEYFYSSEKDICDVVLTKGEPPKRDSRVLNPNKMWKDEEPYYCETSTTIPRTSDSFAKVSAPIVRSAKWIVIIDPYWFHYSKQYLNLLSLILEKRANPSAPLKYITVNTLKAKFASDYEKYNSKTVQKGYLENNRNLPSKTKVTFNLWETVTGKDKFHDRFLLTDVGGLIFSAGLGDDDENAMSKVTCLSYTDWELEKAKYEDPNGAFKLTKNATINLEF